MKETLLALTRVGALPASVFADNGIMRVRDIAADVGPPSLTSTTRPCVGAAPNDSRFYNVDLAPGLRIGQNSFGGALRAGVDIAVTKNGSIRLDVNKIRIDTDVNPGGVKHTRLEIDPVLRGIA